MWSPLLVATYDTVEVQPFNLKNTRLGFTFQKFNLRHFLTSY